jgi:hypothetical protein
VWGGKVTANTTDAPTWWCASGKGAPIFSFARTWLTLIPVALNFFCAGGIGSSPARRKYGALVLFSTGMHSFWCAGNNVCGYVPFPNSGVLKKKKIHLLLEFAPINFHVLMEIDMNMYKPVFVFAT